MNRIFLQNYPRFIAEWHKVPEEIKSRGAANFLNDNGLTSVEYVLDTHAGEQYWNLDDKDFDWFVLKWGN